MTQEPLPPTIREKRFWFYSELIKCDIEFAKAWAAARILALNLSDEELTKEQRQLVEEVCKQWLEHREQRKADD
jgi:hypothetical protein